MNIAIYAKYGKFCNELIELFESKVFDLTCFNSKSYSLHNYVLETSDLLIIQNESYTKDVQLIVKEFKKRNIPVLFYSNENLLNPKIYKKTKDNLNKDDFNNLKSFIKIKNICDGIITHNKKLAKIGSNIILCNEDCEIQKEVEKFVTDFVVKNGKISKKALRFNFAEKMKKNNQKYRKKIYPHLMPDKYSIMAALISYNSQYEKYIKELDYKTLVKAYKELIKEKQPEIFKKFTRKLLKEQRSEKNYRMILKVSKELDCPLDEIVFYILKDIDNSSAIFKDKQSLKSFIEDFCKLSFCEDKEGELIFKIKDYIKSAKTVLEIPDTYNIRNFLLSAYQSDKNYKILFEILELCKNKVISKEELYYQAYLLKNKLISDDVINYIINNNYIEYERFDYSKFEEMQLNKLSCDEKIFKFLKLQKNMKFSPEHFFIRIDGYGKNENWARKVALVTDKASAMILSGENYDKVLSEICFYTKQNALNNPKTDKGNIELAGSLRLMHPNCSTSSLMTQYCPNSRYGITYSEKFKKFKDPEKALKSPYKDLHLTRIIVNKNDELKGRMQHVGSSDTIYCFKYVEKLYNELRDSLHSEKKANKKIIKKIAKIHWILAHNAPWGRGSDSIVTIFVKSLIKSFGYKFGPIKEGLSLDLEAFCTELKDYEKNYAKYYDEFRV